MCALGSSQRRMEKRMRLSGALYGRGHVCPAVCASMRADFRPAAGARVSWFGVAERCIRFIGFARMRRPVPLRPARRPCAAQNAKKGGLWIFPQAAFCACKRGKARFCAPQGRLYRAARRLAHARWQAFTSSTMGMTHNASPSATVYSAMLICVKPKASEMPGR